MVDAPRIVINARRYLHRHPNIAKPGRLRAMINDLDTLIGRAGRIVDQTRIRLGGDTPPGAARLVSLHDPDTRPIRKGRLGKPVEFGYKAKVVDNEDGIVLDHRVEIGNPPDAPQLVSAIKRIKTRCGRPPDQVTADRGYGKATVDKELGALVSVSLRYPALANPARNANRANKKKTSVSWSGGGPASRDGSLR
jgi:IS5 family transposase